MSGDDTGIDVAVDDSRHDDRTLRRRIQLPGGSALPMTDAGDMRAERDAQQIRRQAEDSAEQRARVHARIEVPGLLHTFEPQTENGAREAAASKHLRFTSAQLAAAIAAGTEPHPGRAVLCADGWLAPDADKPTTYR